MTEPQTRTSVFNTKRFLSLDELLIKDVRERLRDSSSDSIRMCLHASEDDKVQEMIVGCMPCAVRPPHCHPDRAETHIMIEGEMTAFLFDGEGVLTERIDLAPRGEGEVFGCHTKPGFWHMMVFRSTPVIYLETIGGPFDRDISTCWAPWGPGKDDRAGIRAFIEGLETI